MRALYPIKKPEAYKDFGVFDIEASNWKNIVVAGYYDLDLGFIYYRGIKPILHRMIKEGKDNIFAHYGGKYDFLFLLDYIAKNEKEMLITKKAIIPRSSSILCFTVTLNDREVTFWDSSALLSFSLRKLTDFFDVDTKKGEIDYKKIKKITPELLEYLESDCKGLHEVLTKFYNQDIIKKSGQGFTVAAQSIKVFRSFLEKPVFGLTDKYDEIIRKSYFGGRTEIFKPYFNYKSKKLKCYDINSMYPYIMANNKFPHKFQYMTKKFRPKEIGFYDLVINVPEMYIPPLPVKKMGKLIFPTGRIEGIYSIPEINNALKYGCEIISINRGYIFTAYEGLFKKYINTLYNKRRKSNNEYEKITYKLLMNSTYGRLGIRQVGEILTLEDGKEDSIPYSDFMDGLFVRKPKYIETFRNVAIASYVTSLSRVLMYKFLMKNPDAVYYCDTDSIFTTDTMDTSDKLGKLKLEYTTNSACFLLPKTYITDDLIKMKGFDKKKTDNFNFENFKNTLRGDLELLKYKTNRPLKTFKQGLKSGQILAYGKKSTKEIKSMYDKRIVIKNDNMNKWDTVAHNYLDIED